MNNLYPAHHPSRQVSLTAAAFVPAALLLGLLSTACTHVPTQFGGSWPLPAQHKSSAAIDVGRPVIEPMAGGLRVSGYVKKQVDAATSANSHIDVQFIDASGSILLEKPTAFVPGDLGGGSLRSRPSAHYETTVAAVPVGTAEVRVVAHDQSH